jgi:hypothetical protein
VLIKTNKKISLQQFNPEIQESHQPAKAYLGHHFA